MSEELILRVPLGALVECLMNAPQKAQMELLSAFVESDNPELRALAEALKVLWVSLEPEEAQPPLEQHAVAESSGEYRSASRTVSVISVPMSVQEMVEVIAHLSAKYQNELANQVAEIADDLVMKVVNQEIHAVRKDAALARFGQALEAIWEANAGLTEEEVRADVEAAIAEVRAERRVSGSN